MKYIIILSLIMLMSGNAFAADETGTNVVLLEQSINDSCFALYNHGTVTYMIYAYNYTGNETPSYRDGFVGAIEPDEMGVLNINSSYYIMADYDTIRDFEDVEKAKSFFNRYWLIFIVMMIILISFIMIVKTVIR